MSHASGQTEPAVTLDPLEIEPDRAGVLRYLGYPAGAAAARRIESKLDEALEGCRGKLHTRAMYSLYPVTRLTARSLSLEGGASFRGEIGEFLGGSRRAAVFLTTAGQEIADLAASRTHSGDMLGSLVYDAIGSHLADALVERVAEHLRSRLAPGELLTLPYSPGYCGISLIQQKTIFGLLDADRIGVELLPTLIMHPLKSVSGLIGIGPESQVKAYGNPCDRCPMTDCRMRRESHG